MHITPGMLVEKYRSRPHYDYEEEPVREKPAPRPASVEAPRVRTQERTQIDFPLDDVPQTPSHVAQTPAIPAGKEPGRFTSFFRHKADGQKTPDQVLSESEPAEQPAPRKADKPAPAPLRAAEPAAPAPAPEPAPAAPIVQEPVSARKEKNTTAREVAEQTAAVTEEIQEKLAGEGDDYCFPPITLLHQSQGENHIEAGAELRNNSRRLAETLSSFGVDATAGDVVHGPAVTRYEFVLDQGVKLSKITNLADDIALALGATGVRIAPIPDKISVVGIEVPNKQVTPVLIRDVLESRDFTEHPSKVAFALGRDIGGRNVIGNIEKLPHVLIAGTTGSGKSVCTNSLIISLLYKSTPDEVRFIMVDPKMVELAPYNGIPHLLIPVVTDPKKAAGALNWAVQEMEHRYQTFADNGVRDLADYNKKIQSQPDGQTLPQIVIAIDELADLMMTASKEVEDAICRLAQKARAAGMHLIIATQRPTTDIITGLIKANIPSRIALSVMSQVDSRTILDTGGAEKLLGHGDMLYLPNGMPKPIRVQGCFVSTEEIEKTVAFVKQQAQAAYDDSALVGVEQNIPVLKGETASPDGNADPRLEEAIQAVVELGQASTSSLQRYLNVGYARAARMIDELEKMGIVGGYNGAKPRKVLMTKQQYEERKMRNLP